MKVAIIMIAKTICHWRYDKMNDTTSLDIMQNDIYGTADIIKQDTLWLARLRTIANEFDGHELHQIADRFEALTNTAHNRKHWTGHE